MILAVGRTRKEWVYHKKAKMSHHGKWANMMNVTVSCDHRTVDGLVAS